MGRWEPVLPGRENHCQCLIKVFPLNRRALIMLNPLAKSKKNHKYRNLSCEMIVNHNGLLRGGHGSYTSPGNKNCICLSGHFGTSWVKHYCTYQRESKRITMVPFDQKSGGKGVSAHGQRGCVPGSVLGSVAELPAAAPGAQTEPFSAR